MEMTDYITETMTTDSSLNFTIPAAPDDIRNSLPRNLGTYIFQVFIGITGVLGNGLVLLVLVNTRDMWDATNVFIANQSLIDFFGSLSVIVFDVIPVPRIETAGQSLAKYLCFVWYNHYLAWVFNYASIINLVFIGFERFYAVRYPIRYRSNVTMKPALAASVLAWIIGGGWGWFLPASSHYENGVCRRPVWPSKNTPLIMSMLTFLVFYLFPLISMTAIYGYIGQVLKRGSETKKFKDHGTGSKLKAAGSYREIARAKVMTTMVIVTVTSIVCWTPSNLMYVAYSLGANVDLNGIENLIVHAFQFTNNCINPFIYTFKYHKFQMGLRRLLRLRGSESETGKTTDEARARSSDLA